MADHLRGVSMLFSAVQVQPGSGTVIRSGDVLLWWEPGPSAGPELALDLVTLVHDLAVEGLTAAAGAGPRLAELLRAGDAQALSGLVLVLPSPTGLRAVVLGTGQVLAPGIDIPRGWADTEIAWPGSMAIGLGDGHLQPPVPGSPYDLVEGGTPGAGAAVVLAARNDIAPAAPPAPLTSQGTAPDPAAWAPSVATAPAPGVAEPEPEPAPEPERATFEAPADPATEPWTASPVGEPAPPPAVAVEPAATDLEAGQAAAGQPVPAGITAPAPVDAPPPTTAWISIDEPSEAAPDPAGIAAEPTVAMPVRTAPQPDVTTQWDAPAPSMPGPPRFSAPLAAMSAPPPAAVYGAIVFDDGSSWALDADYVMGSNPSGAPEVANGRMRPLQVDDRAGQIHPVHAEVRHGDGGTLLLLARAAMFLLPDGADRWQEAPLHTGLPLQPGVRVAIGQRTFTLAPPTWAG